MNRLFTLFSVRKTPVYRQATTRITADGKEVHKQKSNESRITLISPDNSVSITDLRNAQNISLRRELKLVKVQDVDSKTRRPVYKLMTNAEYHEEELHKRKERQALRQNNSVKGEKLLTLSTKIGEHDLMTGVKKMMKLLEKHYEVRVVITGDGDKGVQQSERIYSVIENNLKSICKIVQKQNKGNNVKFQLLPSLEKSTKAGQSPNKGEDDKDNGPL